MSRLLFGGTAADVYLLDDEEGDLRRGGGAVALFYNAKDGGEQYTDLLNFGGAAISSVTTSAGDDGWAAGQLPFFYGPDGVFELFVSVNGSPRVLMPAANLSSYLGPMREQLEAHLTASNRNPHTTRRRDLSDVDGADLDAAPTGQVIVKDASGLWVAGAQAVGGGSGSGDVTTTTDQTISGMKTMNTGDINKSTMQFRANNGQVADLWSCWSSPAHGQGGQAQRTMYANEKGEFRAIAAAANSVAARIKGQPGQTANIMEITDTSNVAKAWFAANYAFYAPNSGRTIPFSLKGNVAVGEGGFFWTNDLGVAMTLRSTRWRVKVAPAGAAIIGDIKVNGVSVFATANRPTIAAGQTNSGSVSAFQSTPVPAGAELTADIVQIGSTTPGADLTCQIELW